MDTLASRSALLVDLHDIGAAFVEDCRSTADKPNLNASYHFHQLAIAQAEEGPAVINRLTEVESTPARVAALDKPFFSWNGSTAIM